LVGVKLVHTLAVYRPRLNLRTEIDPELTLALQPATAANASLLTLWAKQIG
jgi:hypothetical protein